MKSHRFRNNGRVLLVGLVGSGCIPGLTKAPEAASTIDIHSGHADDAVTAKNGLRLLEGKLNRAVKEFTVIAKPIQWEDVPGEMVAAYAHNEQAPGTLLRVREGDLVRIILKVVRPGRSARTVKARTRLRAFFAFPGDPIQGRGALFRSFPILW